MTIFLKVCDHDLLDKAMGKNIFNTQIIYFLLFWQFGNFSAKFVIVLFPVENGGKIQINKIRFAQAWQINSRVELSHLQVFFLWCIK